MPRGSMGRGRLFALGRAGAGISSSHAVQAPAWIIYFSAVLVTSLLAEVREACRMQGRWGADR